MNGRTPMNFLLLSHLCPFPQRNAHPPVRSFLHRIAVLALVVCCTPFANAASYTWTANGLGQHWNNNFWNGNYNMDGHKLYVTNWGPAAGRFPGVLPPSDEDTDIVFGAAGSGESSQNITDPMLLNSLTFGATSQSFQITGSPLKFEESSGFELPTITQSSSNDQSISAPIVLNADLGLLGTATGQLTIGGQISGAFQLWKFGQSTAILNAANTYTGGTYVIGGSLTVGASGTLGSQSGPPYLPLEVSAIDGIDTHLNLRAPNKTGCL